MGKTLVIISLIVAAPSTDHESNPATLSPFLDHWDYKQAPKPFRYRYRASSTPNPGYKVDPHDWDPARWANSPGLVEMGNSGGYMDQRWQDHRWKYKYAQEDNPEYLIWAKRPVPQLLPGTVLAPPGGGVYRRYPDQSLKLKATVIFTSVSLFGQVRVEYAEHDSLRSDHPVRAFLIICSGKTSSRSSRLI